MHSGALFSARVIRFDRRRKEKNGQVIEIIQGKLVWGDGGSDRKERLSERSPTPLERELSGMDEELRKNPNHRQWYTRNVREYVDGRPTETIIKIHPLLIIEFNGVTTTA